MKQFHSVNTSNHMFTTQSSYFSHTCTRFLKRCVHPVNLSFLLISSSYFPFLPLFQHTSNSSSSSINHNAWIYHYYSSLRRIFPFLPLFQHTSNSSSSSINHNAWIYHSYSFLRRIFYFFHFFSIILILLVLPSTTTHEFIIIIHFFVVFFISSTFSAYF